MKMTFTAGIGHRNKQTFRQAPRYERVTYILWFRSKRGEYFSYTFSDQLVSGKILFLSTIFPNLTLLLETNQVIDIHPKPWGSNLPKLSE